MAETSTDITYTIITPQSGPHHKVTNAKIINFLFEHLDEFGDEKLAINKCLNYVFDRGGFILTATIGRDEIIGAVVINDTGMQGYIPEHILVYIAVHKDHRGEGLGKELMEQAIEQAPGSVALHVEPDNPAKQLYEKLGFTNKYLEMRLSK